MSLYELPLTPRHREVALLLSEGRTTDEIARILTVRRDAVADDVDYLMRRLDRRSRAALASWAARKARASGRAAPLMWDVA